MVGVAVAVVVAVGVVVAVVVGVGVAVGVAVAVAVGVAVAVAVGVGVAVGVAVGFGVAIERSLMILAITVALFLSQVEKTHGPISHDGLTLAAPLTEAACVTISERVGINVTTETPEAVMTDAQVQTYFDVFTPQLHIRPIPDPRKRQRHKKHKSCYDPDDED